jgi:hypothetical protein
MQAALFMIAAVFAVDSPVLAQQTNVQMSNSQKEGVSADPDPVFIEATRYRIFAEESWNSCHYADATMWANRSLDLARSIHPVNQQQSYDAKAVAARAEQLLANYPARLAETRRATEEARRELSKHRLEAADSILRVHAVPACDPAAGLLHHEIEGGMTQANSLVNQAVALPHYQYDTALQFLQQAGRVQSDMHNLDSLAVPYREARSEVIHHRVVRVVKYTVIIGALATAGYFGDKEWRIHGGK